MEEKLKTGGPSGIQSQEEIKPFSSVQEPKILTQSILDQVVPLIKEHYQKSSKNLELAILDQPVRVENGEVFLPVIGSVQEEIANKMRPELIDLIRKLSGANQLSISLEHKKEIQSDRPKLYTNSDKLRFLREKHPALAELQRKFGLDVDF